MKQYRVEKESGLRLSNENDVFYVEANSLNEAVEVVNGLGAIVLSISNFMESITIKA